MNVWCEPHVGSLLIWLPFAGWLRPMKQCGSCETLNPDYRDVCVACNVDLTDAAVVGDTVDVPDTQRVLLVNEHADRGLSGRLLLGTGLLVVAGILGPLLWLRHGATEALYTCLPMVLIAYAAIRGHATR